MLFGNGLNFFQVCKCIFEFFFCRRKNRTFWWGFEIILRLCRHFVWRIFFCLVWFYYTKLDFLVRIIKHEEIHGKFTDDFFAFVRRATWFYKLRDKVVGFMNQILRLWRCLSLFTLQKNYQFGFILQNTHQNAKNWIITTTNKFIFGEFCAGLVKSASKYYDWWTEKISQFTFKVSQILLNN